MPIPCLTKNLPSGSTAEAGEHTTGTFPLPDGDTLDADMHATLRENIQAWCDDHFEKLQIQPSMAMPSNAHVHGLKFKVTRVYDSTRTWAYDSDHVHGGCFRKDPTRPNEGSKQEEENDIDKVCVVTRPPRFTVYSHNPQSSHPRRCSARPPAAAATGCRGRQQGQGCHDGHDVM